MKKLCLLFAVGLFSFTVSNASTNSLSYDPTDCPDLAVDLFGTYLKYYSFERSMNKAKGQFTDCVEEGGTPGKGWDETRNEILRKYS